MPLYTFQERFVPFVREGSKRQTIRKFRKYPVRIGQPMVAVTGPRFKPIKIIESTPIVDVKAIAIFSNGSMFLIDTNWLTELERHEISTGGIKYCRHPKQRIHLPNNFAWADGFRPTNPKQAYSVMRKWWKQTHELPFIGFVTYW